MMVRAAPDAPWQSPVRSAHVSCGGRNSSLNLFPISIPHRQDAVYPATIVGIPPMEDFHIGGASVKLFLPIFKMNFPEIVAIRESQQDSGPKPKGCEASAFVGLRRDRRATLGQHPQK